MVSYIEGILKIANLVLAVFAGYLAIRLIAKAPDKKAFKSWKILMVALLLFGVQQILGALRAFNIYSTPHLTHVVPSLILGFVIWALAQHIISGDRV